MSQAPAQPPGAPKPGAGDEPPPGALGEAVLHAAVVGAGWALATVLGAVVASATSTAAVMELDGWTLLALARAGVVVGLGLAVLAHRLPGSPGRRAFAAAVMAFVVAQLQAGLQLGAEATAAIAGRGPPVGRDFGADLASHMAGLASPWTWPPIFGLAVGLWLAAPRRGRAAEGVLLAGPAGLGAVVAHAGELAAPARGLFKMFVTWEVTLCVVASIAIPGLWRGAGALRRAAARGG